MAAVKEALQYTTEIKAMLDCMLDEKFCTTETMTEFLDWAIEQHAIYTCEKIGINLDGFDELMEWSADHKADEDAYEIALPLFRYYLQAYKANRTLTDEQLGDLARINRIRIANLNDLMAEVTPAPAIHKAAHRVACPECNDPAFSNKGFDA